jgi:hypothetical protein
MVDAFVIEGGIGISAMVRLILLSCPHSAIDLTEVEVDRGFLIGNIAVGFIPFSSEERTGD